VASQPTTGRELLPAPANRPRSRVGWILLGIVVVGLSLRTVQYLARTSLWQDEIALVQGILDFNHTELLTRPLPYDQVAPKGFLAAQKAAVLAFGPTDAVLRFIPFVTSGIALIVFASFVNRALTPVAACVATLLVATAAPLIAFAGTVKQYSTDVCVAVVLSWIALGLVTRPVTGRRTWLAATAGGLLQWFSLPSVLVAAGLIVPIVLWTSTTPPEARRRRVGVVVGVWAASGLAITLWSLAAMSAETRDYMRLYWADGLGPVSLADWVRTGWPWPRILRLFRGGFGAQAGLGYPLAPVYPVLATIGFVLLWRRDRQVALILLAPLGVTLAAAAARQYPFSDRLILFLVPTAAAAIAEVSGAAASLAAPYSRAIAALAVAAVSVPAVLPVATRLPPYRVEDLKPVLGYVQARHQRGDGIYVYYGAAPVMTVHASEFGLSPNMYAVGGCHRGETRRYLEELDTFRGSSRVWIILTHSLPVYREREDILEYLDTIGTRLDYAGMPSRAVGHTPFPAEAFLYDLSATARLAAADSASFTVTGPTRTNQRNTCTNGPQALIRSDFVCTGPHETRCIRRPTVPSR
jgi:hypothetical protein